MLLGLSDMPNKLIVFDLTIASGRHVTTPAAASPPTGGPRPAWHTKRPSSRAHRPGQRLRLIEREPSSIRALIQSVGAFGRHAKRTDLPLMERCPVVLSGVRMPRMYSIMQRWIAARRYELLDRTLIWKRAHLLHALGEYERRDNRHRRHLGVASARPLDPLPERSPAPPRSRICRSTDMIGSVDSSTNTTRGLCCTDEIVGAHNTGTRPPGRTCPAPNQRRHPARPGPGP
jgi:hypothetical protein